jgi:hypothetical protein
VEESKLSRKAVEGTFFLLEAILWICATQERWYEYGFWFVVLWAHRCVWGQKVHNIKLDLMSKIGLGHNSCNFCLRIS